MDEQLVGDQISGKALDRYLSVIDVWAMAFGVMVGWGAFVMPGTTFIPVAGPLGSVIALAIGVVIILVIGLNVAYLMNRSPMTGGFYTYTKEAFGRDHAFLCSWFLCLSYLTIVFLNGTAIFVVVKTVFADAAQAGPFYTIAGNNIYLSEVAISVIVLAAIGFLFVVAKPIIQRLHTVLSIVLFAGVVIVAACCLPHVFSDGAPALTSGEGIGSGYGIFSIVILAPWAFVGFEVISFDTAHFNFKVGKSRIIIIVAVLIAGFVYASMTLVSIASVPDGYSSWGSYISELSGLNGIKAVPTFYSASTIMGKPGLAIMGLTALAGILTGIIGAYRAAMRILSTMAEDKILSDKFAKTTYSIFFVMGLSVLLCLLGRNTLNWFVDLTSFGAIVAFGYASAAAWKLARTESNSRVKVTGIIGLIISASFAIVQLVPRLAAMETMCSEAFLMLSLWCLLGFVFYWRTVMRSTLTEYSGMSASGIVLFSLLIYSSFLWLAKRLNAVAGDGVIHSILVRDGLVLMMIIFVGMLVMLYIQDLVRKMHEATEREKIRAVEGSLAKSQFLFNMSHDIRTPMNAIIGYTNLALKEDSLTEIHEYLGKIDLSSKHLLSLINDILEMSRIESGKLEIEYEPVDLLNVFQEIRDLFSKQMEQKQLDFSIHTSQIKNRYVWCDKKNLNRVLLNVISNAYKFTPEGGTVSVSVWESGSGESGYSSYEMRIQDSGIGMSKDFVDKMFTAFEREHTSTVSGVEGTGLGLAITKSIVDLMGGTIDVVTSPGSGTEIILRFKFRLAEPVEIDSEIDIGEGDALEPDFSGRRVLLVEDNAINREIAEMILTQQGFEVDTAENGKLAIDRLLEAGPGRSDAILMDIQMPEMDGLTATRNIRALNDSELANIPIIAMTANAFKEDEQASMEAGMQAHIPKPLDVETMTQTIARVLREHDRK